jgi:hypothetical protein
MPAHLKRVLAVWFVVQIVLPFTAPLQTFDLSGLLGTTHQHSVPASPESSTTPPVSRANSEARTFASPLAVSMLPTSTFLAVVREVAKSGPSPSTCGLSPSPRLQPLVLRL